MSESCFLCTVGASNVIAGGPPPGEGFGTCRDCSVHACRRHGDKSPKHFRCAECIAALGAGLALTEPLDDGGGRLRSEAPRLSAASAPVRERFDRERLGAAVLWIHRQVREGRPLLHRSQHREAWDERANALRLLGLDQKEASPAAAIEEVRLRAAVIEALVLAAVLDSPLLPDEVERDRFEQIGEIGAIGLAIAYMARETEDPEASPLLLRGGLLLPAPVIVLGHVYSLANELFW